MSYNIKMLYGLYEKIDDIVSYMNISDYEKRRKKLFLASNGMYLNYSVPKNSVPHLIGINTTYLLSTDLFRSTSSFELLEELLAKGASWLDKNINLGIINPEILFSKHINKKIESFKDNVKCDMNNIEFVVLCDRNKIIENGKDVENYDYIIVSKINGKYALLGLVKNENNRICPMSNQLYDTIDDLIKENKFRFEKQDITYITSTNSENMYDGYNKSYYMRAEDKKIKINKLRNYSKKFNSTISVFHDYQYSINKYSEFIEGMVDNKGLSNEELITKLNAARAEIVALKEIIDGQNEQISTRNETIDKLEKENKEKEEIIANVRKLVK